MTEFASPLTDLPPAEGTDSDLKKIIVDQQRVDEVLTTLVTAFNNDDFPYSLDSTRTPHDHRHLPESLELGTKEHAMFLWTVCYYMRGGIKSVDAVKRLASMYSETPHLFVAETAQYTKPEVIAEKLKESGLGFQTAVSKLWVTNAGRMQQLYDGDPRNIFQGVSSYEDCLARIKNDNKGGGFVGFQEKMVSMIAYYLMDEGLVEEFDFPLPVDFHVLRISVANELIRFSGYAEDENVFSSELLSVMRGIYHRFAVEHTLRLCDAVWLLSQTLCGRQPGNTTIEPGGRKNRDGRKTVLVAKDVDLNDSKQQKAYADSCAQCPIEESCKWNIPGAVYYVQGELRRRGRRIRFPLPVTSQ